MSKFENVDTRILVDMLAEHTEHLTRLIRVVTVSEEFEERKTELKAIQEELNARKNITRSKSDEIAG